MQIFFSYGHDNHGDFVLRLAREIERLSRDSIKVWIDLQGIERFSHWRERITSGILKSNRVFAFLSQYSTREKSVCRDEISIALVSKHGMVRTILLEDKKTVSPPAVVSEYQWLDLSNYPQYKEQGEESYAAYIAQQAQIIIDFVT